MSSPQPSPLRVVWVVRVMAAALIAGSFAGMLGLSAMNVGQELRVLAPRQVVRGETLPVRALLFDDLSAVAGPRLVSGSGWAQLLDATGQQVARTRLRSGLGQTSEGVLVVPNSAPVRMRLRVRARTQRGDSLEVQLPVTAPTTLAPVMAPEPRPLRGLQQLSFGALLGDSVGDAGVMTGARARLSMEVGGGACVPELLCELFGYGLPPLTRVRVLGHASAVVEAQKEFSAPVPMVIARVTPHGPEALVELEAEQSVSPTPAENAPQEMQRERRLRQPVRLPVALGGQALSVSTRLIESGAPQLTLLGEERGPCIVDAFVEGRWQQSVTVANCDKPFEPPFELPSGLVRLQLRRDPFTSDHAAAVVVHKAGPASPDALAALAAAARAHAAPGSALAMFLGEVRTQGAKWSADERKRAAVQLAVAQEAGLVPLPDSVGSLAEAQAQLSERKHRLRALAVAAVLIACLSLLLSVGRSGVVAAAQAEEVMRLSGQEELPRSQGRTRRRLRIFFALLSLFLGFLAMAAYMLVRF